MVRAESSDSVHSLQSLLSAMRTRQAGYRDVHVYPASAGPVIGHSAIRTEFNGRSKIDFARPVSVLRGSTEGWLHPPDRKTYRFRRNDDQAKLCGQG
jgi:hypothetical protein